MHKYYVLRGTPITTSKTVDRHSLCFCIIKLKLKQKCILTGSQIAPGGLFSEI